MTTFEMLTLDTAIEDEPPTGEPAVLHGKELRIAIQDAFDTACPLLRKPPEKALARLAKLMGVKTVRDADDIDLHEGLLEINKWLDDPTSFRTRLPKTPKPDRPKGIGKLPAPRFVKWAPEHTACSLCADPIAAGDLTGRMGPPKAPYVAMGWQCEHCLYRRRDVPRRRDILLRIFHHLFASEGIGLNAYECGVLHDWLTEDPGLPATGPWLADPIDATLDRLRTSVEEGKSTTWLASTTAHTIVALLQQAAPTPYTSVQDTEMLRAVAQHLDEWQVNPQNAEARKYGAGPRFRAVVLQRTTHPTVLSVRGGPFDLHQTPPQSTELNEE
ncbi:hypothetical protein [Streptomyces netropsis]|uniref:Uncharacterized protein n=1 Tax=Streptomyces netropsis TaxID=55404 RepID=A0A7W7PII7_STRNE|nr:hypothetical protein [Streptomyces netropsis]MBB4890388.1 hypothetical protein [Streptomyces netropsis]GGR46325.1 hypothetical protein GCM10010219_59920 [Streptomyces netropsis]